MQCNSKVQSAVRFAHKLVSLHTNLFLCIQTNVFVVYTYIMLENTRFVVVFLMRKRRANKHTHTHTYIYLYISLFIYTVVITHISV